jgi:hypothetical protein
MSTVRFPFAIVCYWAGVMGVATFCVPPIAAQVPTRDPLVNVDPSLQTIAPKFSPEVYQVNEHDDAETRLLKEQIQCLQERYVSVRRRSETGADSSHFLFEAVLALTEARLEFHQSPEERRQVLVEQLELTRQWEASVQRRVSSGLARSDEGHLSKAFRIKAELDLLRYDKSQAKQQETPPRPDPTPPAPLVTEHGDRVCDPVPRTINVQAPTRSLRKIGRNRGPRFWNP